MLKECNIGNNLTDDALSVCPSSYVQGEFIMFLPPKLMWMFSNGSFKHNRRNINVLIASVKCHHDKVRNFGGQRVQMIVCFAIRYNRNSTVECKEFG